MFRLGSGAQTVVDDPDPWLENSHGKSLSSDSEQYTVTLCRSPSFKVYHSRAIHVKSFWTLQCAGYVFRKGELQTTQVYPVPTNQLGGCRALGGFASLCRSRQDVDVGRPPTWS
jgi:hypothetical protein